MNELDYVILAVLLISTILGIVRGLVREVLAIVGWVLAIFLAMRFSGDLAATIPLQEVAMIVKLGLAAVGIVTVTIFTVGMLGKIIGRMLEVAEITFEDRIIGSVFGLVRGVVIVCACVFAMSMTAVTKSHLWKNSLFIVPAERLIQYSLPVLPKEITDLYDNYTVR